MGFWDENSLSQGTLSNINSLCLENQRSVMLVKRRWKWFQKLLEQWFKCLPNENPFLPVKVNRTWNYKTKLRTFQWFYNTWGKSFKGLTSCDNTYKQTNRDYYLIYRVTGTMIQMFTEWEPIFACKSQPHLEL